VKISVVVPALNEERLIGKCLGSIKEQTDAGDYEIIVVDNGSTDTTARIAASSGVRVVKCRIRGVTVARQAGANASEGDIIVQADADTIYPPWWLSRIRKQLQAHPRAVAVAGTFIYTDPPWWARIEYFLRVTAGAVTNTVFKRPFIISGANFAFYKSAFDKIGGYNAKAYSADQLDISERLCRVGRIVYDGKSYGATSSRSVAKPVITVARDFVHHMQSFARHASGNGNAEEGKRSKKSIADTQ
jgi:glycosyltransferase involved in cell wall biosynthesis